MSYPFFLISSLVSRGPHGINRDNNNRPKTAIIGDTLRNYSSPQNTKYNLKNELHRRFNVELSTQTPFIGKYIFEELVKGDVEEQLAEEYTYKFISTFVDLKKREKEKESSEKKNLKKKKEKNPLKTETIKIQPCEKEHIDQLIKRIIEGYTPQKEDFDFLKANNAIDIALTGRMIASRPEFQVEAALSTNFSFAVHDTGYIQQDYFTAVDSLKFPDQTGSAHLDFFHYSQGVYYSFSVIDSYLLTRNLNQNKELAKETIKQIVVLLATTTPEANKSRCADGLAWPSFVMIEKSTMGPRTLSMAFQKPVKGPDIMLNAIRALEETKSNFDKCYGTIESIKMNVLESKGSLKELIDFIEF